MKYEEVLWEVETFLIKSGIRKYCTEVCKGKCCDQCKSFQCTSKRNLACSTYLCDELRSRIYMNKSNLIFDKLLSLHIEIRYDIEKCLGLETTHGGLHVCISIWNGLSEQQYEKLNKLEYTNDTLNYIHSLDTDKIHKELWS